MLHYATVIRQSMGKDVASLKSGGAAGGIVVALSVFLNAEIQSGSELILDVVEMDEAVKWADLVITGEGMIDDQTYMNKAPYAVALRAKKYGKAVIGISGSVSVVNDELFDGLFSIINTPLSLDSAMKHADELTFQTSKQIAKIIRRIVPLH